MTKRIKFGLAPGGSALIVFAIVVFAIAAVLLMSVSGYAQSSPYVIAASSSPNALPVATSDEADDPILTIKKRVDEVNVLFIATDRHGKFASDTRNPMNGQTIAFNALGFHISL